jgi:hypothetical protein
MSCRAKEVPQEHIAVGITLVELVCILALMASIIMGAKYGYHFTGSWYGYLLGGILGFIVFFVFIFALGSVINLWSGSGLPKCRNGCCRGPGFLIGSEGDYEFQVIDGEPYELCKCGDRYRRQGKRFVLVNEDGTETPYLIWRRLRGWVPDKEQSTA